MIIHRSVFPSPLDGRRGTVHAFADHGGGGGADGLVLKVLAGLAESSFTSAEDPDHHDEDHDLVHEHEQGQDAEDEIGEERNQRTVAGKVIDGNDETARADIIVTGYKKQRKQHHEGVPNKGDAVASDVVDDGGAVDGPVGEEEVHGNAEHDEEEREDDELSLGEVAEVVAIAVRIDGDGDERADEVEHQ
eukprot:gb/GECH01012100.1/.p1 GENE.gb/GECH01012100.1/~~gb/GECH01012100.1/.p1  ORF type:complete len:190 (+),score=38.44 gb/GECH01012100.1/:1-570(+)